MWVAHGVALLEQASGWETTSGIMDGISLPPNSFLNIYDASGHEISVAGSTDRPLALIPVSLREKQIQGKRERERERERQSGTERSSKRKTGEDNKRRHPHCWGQ